MMAKLPTVMSEADCFPPLRPSRASIYLEMRKVVPNVDIFNYRRHGMQRNPSAAQYPRLSALAIWLRRAARPNCSERTNAALAWRAFARPMRLLCGIGERLALLPVSQPKVQ